MNIFLAGDSTMQTYNESHKPQAGWGQFIQEYFDESAYAFHNHAIGGRSSKSFIVEGRLDRIIDEIQKDDLLIVQMGHNDSTKQRPERYTEPFTSYKEYMEQYIDKARNVGAIPILITPVGRLHLVDEQYINDFPEYCEVLKLIAEEKNVELIDLNTISLQAFQEQTKEEVESYFMISVNGTDCTHFTEKGAKKIAEIVSKELKKLSYFSS